MVLVVASGVKSILDVGATLERLDTFGVPVLGYQTEPSFQAFICATVVLHSTGRSRARRRPPRRFLAPRVLDVWSLLANPVGIDHELDRGVHDAALASSLEKAKAEGLSGKAVTPAVLSEFARHTAGRSVQVNRDLVVANASLAGEVAANLARLSV